MARKSYAQIDFVTNKGITLADPTAAQDASTKAYTDTKVAKSGDTMTGLLTIDRGPGAGIPLITLKTNAGTQTISSDGSSYTTFSNGISVPVLYTQGIGFTTFGAQIDLNGASVIQGGKFTTTSATGHFRNYADYNAGQAVGDQGFIHTYANRQSGGPPQVAFQAHKAGDISEQPFMISSNGYGHIRNLQVDKPTLTLRGAASQSAEVLRVENSAGTAMLQVDKGGALVLSPDTGTAKGRFGTLPSTPEWLGMFMNAQYVPGAGWALDDTSKPGWFMKVDSRNSPVPMYAVYYIPSGAGYHTDEYEVFSVQGSGVVTVRNRITGLPSPTADAEAANKAYVDSKTSGAGREVFITGTNPGVQTVDNIWVDESQIVTDVSPTNFLWSGTQAQYDAITPKNGNTLYVVI